MDKSFFDLPMGQNSLEELKDKENIRELVEYERYCRDYHHYDAMKKLFVNDSRVNVSWMSGSGEEFVEASKKREGNRPYMGGHKIFNTIVWLNGNKAIAESMAMIIVRGKMMNIDYDMPAYSRVLYRVEKIDNCWKIKQLDCIYEFDSIYASFPMHEADVFKPGDFDDYRSSYKGICWIEEKMGGTPNQELAGEDDPNGVEVLYQKANEWLFQE